MKQRQTILIALFLLLVAGIVALFNLQKNPGSPANSSAATNGGGLANPLDESTKGSRSKRERISPNRNEKMAAQLEAARIGSNHMVALWVKSAEGAFAKASQRLANDLGLSDEQAAKVDALFDSRKEQLTGMLNSLTSDEAEDPHETLRKIIALMRHKGLRDGLAGILTSGQLAAFDAAESNRQRESIEAKALSEMAAVTSVLTLTDSQKQKVLAALSARVVEIVEEEADARALMVLPYGEMAAKIDVSNARGLAGALNADLDDVPGFQVGSTEYFLWKEKQRAEQIERELSPLRYVLDQNQLARYREHLETETPR